MHTSRPQKLGEAESFALTQPDPDVLRHQPGLKSAVAAASVRALSYLGAAPEVLDALATYVGESRTGVLKELMHAAASFDDKETYARRVLSASKPKKFDLTAVRGKPNDLELVASMTTLQELKFAPWEANTQIALLGALAHLETLIVGRVEAPTLDGLEQLTALRTLTMYWCEGVERIDALAKLDVLINLNLYSIRKVTTVKPLEALRGLDNLTLAGADVLGDLDGLEALTQLKRLTLRACQNLRDLGALASLTELDALELNNALSLVDLSPLASLSSLRKLEIAYNRTIEDIAPLGALTSLEHLSLWVYNAKDYEPLAPLTNLRTLSLSSPHLTSLEMLGGMKSLKNLSLIDCPQLVDLETLLDLPNLNSVTVWARHGHDKHPVFTQRKEISLTVY